jgi:hypothetical protein
MPARILTRDEHRQLERVEQAQLRLAGKVIVEVEFGPRRGRIEEFLRKALSEPYLGVVRPATRGREPEDSGAAPIADGASSLNGAYTGHR